jgi:GNAT superfamily N-acetyltransferase
LSRVDPGNIKVQPLDGSHDRVGFRCGVESLDNYLRTQASQDARRKATSVFVLVAHDAPSHILGYFTLSAFGIDWGDIPDHARKNIPRYPRVGATLIGRLAVDKTRQGQGVGAMTLYAAIRKAYENASIVGSSMIVVDTLDEGAARFYEAHGFIRLPGTDRLILPMRTAKQA